MIRSQNALNFGYLLYLMLRDKGENPAKIASYVKRWFVLSILTQRSSGSFESQFDYDIKQIAERPFGEYLAEVEAGVLGEAFWEATLPQSMNTPLANSPFFFVFLAAQIVGGDRGFLSKDIPVVASVLPFQTSSAFVPKIMAQFEPVLSEAALAVL
jgi:hypothetical protein